jgi:tetratricopeptide (TPR) repeat protein
VVLNKARTSIWMKTLIIFMIVALVTLFMYQGVAGIFELFQQPAAQPAATTTQSVASIEQEHKPIVTALQGLVASNPTSYTVQLSLAKAHYDWADALSRPLAGQSQVSTAAAEAAYQQWGLAKAAYDAATKLTKTFDPPTQTDRSYATLESNEPTEAIKIATTVTKKAPNYAPGWEHLGIFLEAVGRTNEAIPAFRKYLALDPKGQNAAYIKGRLDALTGSTTATKTP